MEYFNEQLRLSSSVVQLVQAVILDDETQIDWDESQDTILSFKPAEGIKIVMTVHPHYQELLDLEFMGFMKNKLPVFSKKH